MSKIKLLVAFLHEDNFNLLSEAEFGSKLAAIFSRLSSRDLKCGDLLQEIFSIKSKRFNEIAIKTLLIAIIKREHGMEEKEAGNKQDCLKASPPELDWMC